MAYGMKGKKKAKETVITEAEEKVAEADQSISIPLAQVAPADSKAGRSGSQPDEVPLTIQQIVENV